MAQNIDKLSAAARNPIVLGPKLSKEAAEAQTTNNFESCPSSSDFSSGGLLSVADDTASKAQHRTF